MADSQNNQSDGATGATGATGPTDGATGATGSTEQKEEKSSKGLSYEKAVEKMESKLPHAVSSVVREAIVTELTGLGKSPTLDAVVKGAKSQDDE